MFKRFITAGLLYLPVLAHAAVAAGACPAAVPCKVAPELDPGSGFAALTLLVGAIAVLRGRRNK